MLNWELDVMLTPPPPAPLVDLVVHFAKVDQLIALAGSNAALAVDVAQRRGDLVGGDAAVFSAGDGVCGRGSARHGAVVQGRIGVSEELRRGDGDDWKVAQ